ncbi:MAG: tetratricopeptide repeat protein [Myxococcales bacterium]|nr:tetratricopeptide repeat protein [Myxococcales bacterium]
MWNELRAWLHHARLRVRRTHGLLVEAGELYEQGAYADAVERARLVTLRRPSLREGWELLGLALHHLGEDADAVAAFERGIAETGPTGSLWHHLGNTHAQFGRSEEAIDCYARATAIEPRCAEIYYSKALALFVVERVSAGLFEARIAAGLKPREPRYRCLVAQGLSSLGRVDEAFAEYREALALDPAYAEIYCDLGTLYQEQDQIEEARACYETAIRLDNECATAFFNLGTLARWAEDDQDACLYFERAAALDPEDAVFHYELAGALAGLGLRIEAIRRLSRALRLDPALGIQARTDEDFVGLHRLRTFRRLVTAAGE